MLLNSTKMLLTNVMMIGVIMTICSNNWISMWMGLEMTMMSFIPMMQNNNQLSSQSMMKYFIVQSIASTMFLFMVIFMLIGVDMNIAMQMISISMTIKLGLAPFHNWVLMVIEYMKYSSVFIMLTVMKIQPMYIIHQINMEMMTVIVLFSMLLSSFSGLNQSSIRKILGFSSIYNMSVMMLTINKLKISMTYMFVYSVLMILLMLSIKSMKINYINQMVFSEFSMWTKMNIWLNMLSMSGFPPTMGFIIKMMIIQTMISQNQLIMSSMLILSSILVMVFYMRLVFNSMLSMYSFKKWNMSLNKPMYFLMTMNLSMVPIFSMMTNIM